MAKRISDDIVRTLIVEGSHDELFFESFLAHLGIKNVQCFPIGGKTLLESHLKAFIKDPRFPEQRAIGIVRDADNDAKAALESVRNALNSNGLVAPKNAWVFSGHAPAIYIAILPDEKNCGALETLCLRSKASDEIITCVDAYFECLSAKGIATDSLSDKHRIQTYLASKKEDFLQTGTAAKNGYWKFEDPAFNKVRSFLVDLAK
jgi:hypothetical protein